MKRVLSICEQLSEAGTGGSDDLSPVSGVNTRQLRKRANTGCITSQHVSTNNDIAGDLLSPTGTLPVVGPDTAQRPSDDLPNSIKTTKTTVALTGQKAPVKPRKKRHNKNKNTIDETIGNVNGKSQQISHSLSDSVTSPGQISQLTSDDESFVFKRHHQRDENTLVLLITTLHQEIADLTCLVRSQSVVIQQMQTQIQSITTVTDTTSADVRQLMTDIVPRVSAIAKFFDIDAVITKNPVREVSNAGISPTVDTIHDQVTFRAANLPHRTSSQQTDAPLLTQIMQHDAPVSQRTTQHAVPAMNFRQAVLTTVHIDRQLETRRASNIVITGLAAEQGLEDSTLVSDLCSNEFGLLPDIVECKRIGQQMSTNVQPLLVKLANANEASRLLENAKYLQKSKNSYVRQHVFINKYMSRAEQQASYELRVERRRRREARSNDDRGNGGSRARTPSRRAWVVHNSRTTVSEAFDARRAMAETSGAAQNSSSSTKDSATDGMDEDLVPGSSHEVATAPQESSVSDTAAEDGRPGRQ
jgi:hypothetical protein